MKIKNLFFTALATMALASCSDNEEIVNGGLDNPVVEKGDAYISFAMKMPTSIARANGAPNAGSEVESKVTTALALLFDGDQATSKLVTKKTLVWTGETATFAGKASDAFKVDSTATKILVVANPTTEIINRAEEGATLSTVKEAFSVGDISSLTTKDQFTMSNYKLVDCKTFIVKGTLGETEDAVKNKAKDHPVVVPVDRLVAKVTLEANANLNDNANVTIEEWALNVTNQKFLLLPDTCTATELKDGHADSFEYFLYTKDANFENKAAWTLGDYQKEFKVDNGYTAYGADTKNLYCAENTMQATDQLYNYTTQALLKVSFIPAKDTKGAAITDSWFRFEGKAYTADNIAAAFTAATDDSTLKTAGKAFADSLGKGEDFVAALEAVDETTSAKVATTGIEYFHKGYSYYKVMIRHNQLNDKLMTLGRYGVVRNNWYTLTVTSISEPGLSYPETPEQIFKNKTEDDVLNYLSVQISVKPWTTWNQNIEL